MTNEEPARQLNISPAALSLTVNHKSGVSGTTRKRVIRRPEELEYSHLIKQPQAIIAENDLCFVIYKRHGRILNQHPFFLLLTESVEGHAREYEYHISLTTVDGKSPIDNQIENLN